jgi:hypothetical protein
MKFKCYCHDPNNGKNHGSFLGEATMDEMIAVAAVRNKNLPDEYLRDIITSRWTIVPPHVPSTGYLMTQEEWELLLQFQYKEKLDKILNEKI